MGQSEQDRASVELTRVGRFVVLRALGAGAMGVVYSAYDEELDRRVAIKLLRVDPHDAQRRARLMREAQAMARLSHPNVVHVYEAGEHCGQVYVAMEFIEGRTLSEWLRGGDRGWREILALFLQVGAGLASAHRAGLVHRDVKPDNILIGDDGRAVIADFGLARYEAPTADETTPGDGFDGDVHDTTSKLTDARTWVGTPAYMPPEQHLRGAVDARSDQYSFCASLYESLYGALPFNARTRAELILEITQGTLPNRSRGGKVPHWVYRTIRRGLAAEPGDRWETMEALLAALSRNQWRRGLRIASAAVAGAVLSTVVHLSVRQTPADATCTDIDRKLDGVWGDVERRAVEDALLATGLSFAPDTAGRVETRIDHYVARWKRTYADVCAARQAGEAQAPARGEPPLVCLDVQLAEVRALVQVLAEADATIAENAVHAVAWLDDPEDCTSPARVTSAGIAAVAPEARGRSLKLRDRLAVAKALEHAGHYQRALMLALEVLRAVEDDDLGPLRAQALFLKGDLLELLGDFSAAESALVQAFWAAETYGDDSVKLGAATTLMTVVGEMQARYSEARLWEQAGFAVVRRTGPGTVHHAELLNSLGALERTRGDLAAAMAHHQEALGIRRKLLGDAHPVVASSLNNLGVVYYEQGAFARALDHYRQAAAIYEEFFGDRHPMLAGSLHNIGSAYFNIGDYADARVAFERSLAIREEALGRDHPKLALPLLGLGEVYRRSEQYERAEQLNRQALSIFERAHGTEHPLCAYALTNLGSVMVDAKRMADAIPPLERALAIRERSHSPIDDIAETRSVLAAATAGVGARDLARAMARQAIDEYRRAGAGHEEQVARLEALLKEL